MTEWLMVAVLKTAFVSFGERGFESHPLRQLGNNLPMSERLFMLDESGNYKNLEVKGFQNAQS